MLGAEELGGLTDQTMRSVCLCHVQNHCYHVQNPNRDRISTPYANIWTATRISPIPPIPASIRYIYHAYAGTMVFPGFIGDY